MPAASQRTQAPPLTDTRRQQGGRPEVRLEAAPLPSPTPPAGGGGAARGPRQNERRGPTHHERPSLTWRGLSPSPGERHITTSISPGRAREEPRRGEGGPAKTITTGACSREAHRVEDPTGPRALPPSGQPKTGGDTAAWASWMHKREPAHRPRRAAPTRGAKGRVRPWTAAESPKPPTCIQRPKVSSDRR